MATYTLRRTFRSGSAVVPLRFTWRGGGYVDVSYEGHATDVINVYDYETGECRIKSNADFVAVVADYCHDKANLWDHAHYAGVHGLGGRPAELD